MKAKILLVPVFVLFLFSALYPQKVKVDDKTSLNYMKTNLQFLSSNELEGRETGTRAEKITGLYIASEFQKYGVKPFGDNGTYFQKFNLAASTYSPESKLHLMNADGTLLADLTFGADFIKPLRTPCDDQYKNAEAPVVFAGFGITAPEFNYDDYKNIDVNGKIVLILTDKPYSDNENFFTGNKALDYSKTQTKIDNAQKHGAIGVLLIPEPWRVKYWSTYQKTALQVTYAPAQKSTGVKVLPSLVLSEAAAKKLLQNEGLSYDELILASSQKVNFSSKALQKKAKLEIKDLGASNYAENVVGLIEGNDPKLKNEYVILSAHMDHLGITKDGVVYNGADDDGSGAVTVIETARVLAENKLNKRSVIALLNTGEEKGLWGSAYAANNSEFIPSTVADINIDMDGRENPDSIYVIGSGKLSTEYYNLIKDVNQKTIKMGFNYKFDDPNDPERFYYRSDHYNFAQKGIPIVFFFDDMTVDYHKPSDKVEKIEFEKMLKIVKLAANIAVRVANLDHKLVVDKPVEKSTGR